MVLFRNIYFRILIIGIFLIGSYWLLTRDIQRDIPYRVDGQQYLKIQAECKQLAESRINFLNKSNLIKSELVGSGYSEYKGFCYAEILESHTDFKSKQVYDTTNAKVIYQREWPKDSKWYESDFDRLVLGKIKIWDIRQP